MDVFAIARPKDIEGYREEFIVYEPIVESEESHEKNKVPHLGASFNCDPDLRIHQAKQDAYKEEQEAVADVAKHHTEEEGEGNNSEDCRIHLFVHRDTVGIHDLLKGHSELVSF